MPTRADYAKINIACKQLGINKRDLIFDRYGKETSKDLSRANLVDLMGHFRAQGWRPTLKVKDGRNGHKRSDAYIKIPPGPAAGQQRYVVAMWKALGYDMGKLHTRCKKQFKVDRFEWLTDGSDLHILITDLQSRSRAAGLDPEAS